MQKRVRVRVWVWRVCQKKRVTQDIFWVKRQEIETERSRKTETNEKIKEGKNAGAK